ncbi:MAG: RHS repeat-associated core domain-containing protein [Nitrospirota bacterium]
MNNLLKTAIVTTMLILFQSELGLGSEKVYFYYTDPAGTPLVMSDSTGTVVWRADYLPFGEESLGTQTVKNNKMFVGKEKDSESGLYYFGARYMDDGIGRFASTDPVRAVNAVTGMLNVRMLLNPQSINVYAYAMNNPYKFFDAQGKWPEIVHTAMIMQAFSNGKYELTQEQIQAMRAGSANADSGKYQTQEYTHMHAMASAEGPNKDKSEAIRQMNAYISEQIALFKKNLAEGNEYDAYFALGMAFHPFMDSTSPSHAGMQVWTGKWDLDAFNHIKKESITKLVSDQKYMREAVELMRKQYNGIMQ